MTDRELLDHRLDQYEDAPFDERSAALQKMCRDLPPQLVAELRREVDLLARVDDMMEESTGGMMAEHTIDVPREAVAGRYQATKLLGHGGLGQVFRAEDRELGREVALKRIVPGRAAMGDNQARFRHEAKVTARLEHPGVVPIYGLSADAAGRPYYAMRLLPNHTLDDAIETFHRDHPLGGDPGSRHAARQALVRRFLTVCQTVAYAHSKGVLHRDLKPQNIIAGDYGETIVIDWGLAREFGMRGVECGMEEGFTIPDSALHTPHADPSEIQETLAGQRKGSPAYMSPEQAAGRNRELDARADVYSLGATLYKILTGRPPFAGAPDIFERIARGEFPRPRLVRRDVPAALESICLQAMRVKPEDRYAAASELAADVERWLADEPVTAAPEPLADRFRRWRRRHRTLVFASVAATVVGVLALSALAVQQGRANVKQKGVIGELGEANERTRVALTRSQRNLYVTRVNAAAVALAEGKFARARDLIRAAMPQPGETEDFRDFEWYHLAKALYPPRRTLSAQMYPHQIELSADGQWLAIHDSRQVKAWNMTDGRSVLETPDTDITPIIALSPTAPLLALRRGRHVELWRLDAPPDAKPLLLSPAFRNHHGDLAFSPDGRLLAASGDGGRLLLWDAAAGELRREILEFQNPKTPATGGLDKLVFSADGKRLAALGSGGPVIWDVAANQRGPKLERGEGALVVGFEDGYGLFTIQEGGILRQHNAAGKHMSDSRLPGRAAWARSFPTPGESARLLVHGQSHTWLLRRPVRDPRIGPGSDLEPGEGWALPVPLAEWTFRIGTTPDGNTIAGGGPDGRITLLHCDTFEPATIFPHQKISSIDFLGVLPDRKQFVTGAGGPHYTILLSSLAGIAGRTFPTRIDSGVPLTAALSWDGLQLAWRDRRDRIAVADVATGERRVEFNLVGKRPAIGDAPLTFVPRRPLLAYITPRGDQQPALSPDGSTLRVRDLATNRDVAEWSLVGVVTNAIAASPDGKLVALANEDGKARVFQVDNSGAGPIHEFRGPGHFTTIAFSPDGNRLAAGTRDGWLLVWEVNGPATTVPVRLHQGEVTGLAFFPNGHLLATGGADRTVRIWDVRDRVERCTLQAKLPVKCVAVAPDGRFVAAGCDRGVVRLFRRGDDDDLRGQHEQSASGLTVNAEHWRDLALACWSGYLARQNGNDVDGARKLAKQGLEACERLRELEPYADDAPRWEKVFRELLSDQRP